MADLSDLLDWLAERLPPPTTEEVARSEQRHRWAHQRGVCDCDNPPPGEVDRG